MSSGFVSGGTTEQPIERDDEWLKVQQEIEATRRRKEEESRQDDGKSLYETLQQNKAAKQDAFEESIRLKNQFRTLDEDEVEFLDSVLESTRAKEDEVKREIAVQLDLFRQQQEDSDRIRAQDASQRDDEVRLDNSGSPILEESSWAVSNRKRKRAKEKEVVKGIKQRKSSQSSDNILSTKDGESGTETKDEKPTPLLQSNISTSPQAKSALLGLGGYDSDEDA
ncbi:hypothetical protein MMC13_007629 [Lambiella insularis]|nr:hypothetical protein [Lambiella insularis]